MLIEGRNPGFSVAKKIEQAELDHKNVWIMIIIDLNNNSLVVKSGVLEMDL